MSSKLNKKKLGEVGNPNDTFLIEISVDFIYNFVMILDCLNVSSLFQ